MREKLIELEREATDHASDICIEHRDCEDCPGRKYGTHCRDYLKADYLISNGVTVQKWIPVSVPPKEKGRYWCNVKSFAFPGKYYQTVLKWDDGFVEGSIYTDDVTHWMPMPKPPKGE
jgi:hypothetical protein